MKAGEFSLGVAVFLVDPEDEDNPRELTVADVDVDANSLWVYVTEEATPDA